MPTFQYDNVATKSLSPATCKAITEQLKQDVDNFCIQTFSDDYRHHLGMSIIGEDCWRKIWYMWRWAKTGVFDGRMLRLFNRGHKEETRFIEWLKGIGATVWEVDPSTGKQFKLSGLNGHYGGSTDAKIVLPYLPDLEMLGEFKTHNEKSFTNLLNKGLEFSKPQHFTQMCSYGKYYNLQYGLYCAVDKNDDELYFEIVKLDWNQADQSLIKAEEIIYSKVPPAKISPNPTYYKCKNMCQFLDICHNGKPLERNCRSCRNASPIENAEWFCARWNAVIPKEELIKGCTEHVSIGLEN